jgi:outer membrane protein assembly factor BamA
MPIRGAVRAGWAILTVAALLAPASAPALVQVDALTEVRSIRFEGLKSLNQHRLQSVLQTKDRGGAYGLRVALGKLPLVPSPARQPFSPLTLQEDVARIRRAYAAAGFFRPKVRYTVKKDEKKNLLDITFVIDEGAPARFTAVSIVPRDTLTTLPIPANEQKAWRSVEKSILAQRGRRVSVEEARGGRDRLIAWWRNRGHPLATVTTRVNADSARTQVQITYRVAPGPFARFGPVSVTGNHSVNDRVIRHQANIVPGRPYSDDAMNHAELDLQELDIVRVAHVEAPSVLAADSALADSLRRATRLDSLRTVAGRVDSIPLPAAESTAVVARADSGRAGARVATVAVESGDSVQVAPWSPAGDSMPSVLVRITEADRRLVSGDLGYVSDAGLSSEAHWTHRNFSGGGRSLTVTGLAQTGWLAVSQNPDRRYRFSVALKQPSLVSRRVSGVLTPFIEYRNDTQDRSLQYGYNVTLVRRKGALQTLSLDYQLARRHIYQYNFEDLASGDIDLLTFLTQVAQGQLDSLGTNLLNSTVTLSATVGKLDDAANPRRGAVIRPAFQVTVPTALSSTSFYRLDVTANGFMPVGKNSVLAIRARAGDLYPFGKSLPGPGDDAQTKFLQLRDVSFTGGGTGDVRGWENRLLGPKVPDVRFEQVGDSLVAFADGYVPYGGFAKMSFSAELRMPLPGMGPNFGSLVFLDGGRVWTDDPRFGPTFAGNDPNGQERLFMAAGLGFMMKTPVGPVQISAGYKLNPSILDLASSEDVLRASAAGIPLDTLHRKNSRRWQLHLSIGSSY